MSVWGEAFLGVIALATLAIAVVLVGVLVAAGRLARRAERILDQFEVELKPLFDHLNAIGRDVSRAAALATAQVERVDRAINDVAQRLEHTIRRFQAVLDGPAREGSAILTALAAALRALRGGMARRARGEEEDSLFI